MAIMFDGNFFIAVIASTILSFVIGGIWYAGPVFGKAWMAALGKTEADKEAMRKQAPKGFAVGLVGSLHRLVRARDYPPVRSAGERRAAGRGQRRFGRWTPRLVRVPDDRDDYRRHLRRSPREARRAQREPRPGLVPRD